MEKVNIQLDSYCKGVTGSRGEVYKADKRGDVVLPSSLADELKESGAVRPARRLFGGFTLPKSQG